MTKIEYVECIDSTNEELKRRVNLGLRDSICLVADEQTAGKGRKGRSFFSPGGSVGIYMSYLYFTDKAIEDAVGVTTAVAVIAARAIEEATGVHPLIKWVNDLYVNQRKVAGILTELVPNVSSNTNALVVGIGINLSTKFFPEDIRGKAGAILGAEDTSIIRKNIIEAITLGLDDYTNNQSLEPFMDEYRKRSCVLGKSIIYSDWNEQIKAKVCQITDKGHLVVMLDTGEKRTLDSGEISIVVQEWIS